MAITVLLVDDVDELRAVVRQALRLQGGFEVVAEARDGAGAIAAASRRQPDVVVLDLGLPDLAGREVLTGLREAAPEAQVVVFTGSLTEERAVIGDQVEAFVRKDQDVGYLVELLADLGRRRYRTASMEIGRDSRNVAAARRFVREQCQRWGCHDAVDDARVVASELVTNALVHAGTGCGLQLRLARNVLRIEVDDRGAGVPDLQSATRQSEGGRGLHLVSSLCAAWGVDAMPDGGKMVWAELPTRVEPGNEPAAPPASASPTPEGGPGGGGRRTGPDTSRSQGPEAQRDGTPRRRPLRPTGAVTFGHCRRSARRRVPSADADGRSGDRRGGDRIEPLT